MTGCHETRPLLPARAEELTPLEAQMRADHVAVCSRCAAEAASFGRLGAALAMLAGFEAQPPEGTLERVLAAIGRRRVGVADPRVAAVAAGSAGAVLGAILVARAMRQRRRSTNGNGRERSGRLVGVPLAAVVRAR
ncbi:MAG TPA: hypothetical protein VF486_11445 [Actinomycetes bacterium]